MFLSKYFHSAAAAKVVSVAQSVAESAISALVARNKPAIVDAVNKAIDVVEASMSSVSPATVVSLEAQLHNAVASQGWALPVVSAVQVATSAAIASGALASVIEEGDDLSKAQMERLRARIVAEINAI